MKFEMTTPCKHCPFRSDIPGYLHPKRAESIAEAVVYGNATFPCHKTLDYDAEDEDMDAEETEHTNMCAGALILIEKENPGGHQLLRIMERFGAYDFNKMNMDAPVFDSVSEMVEHHDYAFKER